MSKIKLKDDIEELKRLTKANDIECPYLKIDLDYVERLIDGNLTPEEQAENDKQYAMEPDEWIVYVDGMLKEHEDLLKRLGCIREKK